MLKCKCEPNTEQMCTALGCVNQESVSKPRYWDLEAVVSNSFNRFKGKLYNLIESTQLNPEQQKAIKGLIRGFANDEYRNCLEEMRYYATGARFIPQGEGQSIPPLGAEPLETPDSRFR